MADRYWVGGSGSWNSTTKWSATSGGTSGASVPTSADNAIFDANSGTAHFTVTVTDNATCANLTITPEPVVGVTEFVVGNGFVIAGTFSTSGTAGNRRVWFRSSTYGLMRDIRIASIGSVSDVDFRDIRVTGTAAPISGTRIGDLRGNSGITFSTPKTVYWNLPAGSAWDQNAWASTSGGSVSTDNFPLAQDIAVIENTGLNTGSTLSLSLAIPYIGSIDMSSRTLSFTLTIFSNSVYGDWKNGSGVTLSGTSIVTFSGRKTQTITSAGKTISFPVTVDSYGGTVELADALNIGSQTLTVTNGTFDTKGYAVTAGSLSSNNSNVRAINLGASTLTLSGSPTVQLTTATNLTFNCGTSQINHTSANSNFNGGGLTFYNVLTTSTATNFYINFQQQNTFNNITITPPASEANTTVFFDSNQTITGALTVAGATAVRRIFVQSSVLGTQRTLTVNNLSATDCDFRDIRILGAAGSTPTRAGDCGGNAGITFPAPKTVYWNLAGAQNWSATGWAASSGGTPNVNNFPLAQDTAVFDNTGSVTGTITINAAWNIGTFDASARTSAMTLTTGSIAPFVYGNWLFGTGVTSSSTTGTITFAGRGTNTITSNGVLFGCPITIDSFTGTVQLADALAIGETRTLTLTSGTFDAVNYNVTTGLFGTGSGTKTLRMGSGTWTLSGIGTVWDITAGTTIFYKGTANIILSNTSASNRNFFGNSLSYNKLTIGGATGTSTLTIGQNNQFTELSSTKTVAHTIAFGSTTQTFGKWTVSGTAGNVVTLTGTGTSHIIAGACTEGIDYLAMGSIGFATTSPGEFYAGANSTGTAAAPVYRTAKPADSVRYWVGGSGNWSDTARWSASSGGTGGASIPRSHDDVIFDSASNATAYTATVNAVTGGIRMKALNIAGPASGNLTLAGTTAIDGIHSNVTLPATGLTRTYTGNITLSGSTSGKTFTINGVTLASGIVVNGVNCEWSLGSALNMGSSSLNVTNGSFYCNTYNLTLGSILSNNTNSRTIDFSSGTVTISGASAINFGATQNVAINLTVTNNTSTINLTGSATLSGNGKTFYNVAFTSTSAATVTLNGTNTFNNLSFTGLTSVGLKNISVTADQTISGTLTLSAGTNATMRHFVQSDVIGTTRTLTCAAVSATDADFRDITIAGAAAPASGTRLGDCKGNSGVTFDAAKTVYWRVSSGGNWGSTGDVWSLTPSGASDVNNTPLAQDTAVFTSTLPASGATVTINVAYNIGTIDMSARTSNTMTLATGTQTPAIYGNWINGTGTTLSGSGTLTFAGRSAQTITSAGKTFSQVFSINSISGSVTLQDAIIVSGGVSHFAGTFDVGGYTFTTPASFFTNSGTATRNLSFGSGNWVLSGSSNPFTATATGLSITGTGTISLTSASAKTFAGGGISYSGITLNQGGLGTLTITGNNTFANITNTYKTTGATTIALGTTTQRVGAFGASGEAGRVLTITGTSATSPATLVFTGSGQATTPTTDYLTITGVRAYSLDTTWYAGNNSTNNGSLGWYFVAGGGGAVTAFIIEASTAAESQSSFASLGVGISETITASEAQASGLICLGTLSESATAADVAAAFLAYLSAVAESTTATDLIAASLTLNAAISELTTGSEQVAATLSLSASVSELVAAADSLSGGLLFLSSISEATTAQELVAASLIFNLAISEAATATDVLVAIATFNAAVPESVSGSDVAQALLAVDGTINESLAALDSLVVTRTTSPEISEAVTAQEAAANAYTANPSISEMAQSADASSVAPSTFGAVALAAAQVVEYFNPAGSVYNASLPVESAGITDFLVGSYLWNPIDDMQAANWQNVSSGQTPAWTSVVDAQTPGWQGISSTQSPTWTQVDDEQVPVWVVIPTSKD